MEHAGTYTGKAITKKERFMKATTLSEYRARNDAALVEVKQALEAQGLTVVNVDNALRCELRLGEILTGYAFFVSAPFLFSLKSHPKSEPEDEYDREQREKGKRYFEIDFREFQQNLMYETFSGPPHRECYLFIVGSEAFLQKEVSLNERARVETDSSIARKFVGTLPQALTWTQSLFDIKHVFDAQSRPTFDALQDVLYLKEDAPDVTDVFTHRDLEEELDPVLLSSSSYAAIRARTESILLRIVGPEYRVFWYSDGICLGFLRDAPGIPLAWASSGERKAFMFAHFLARLADSAGPHMRLGIYNALNGITVIWLLGALDVLREFSFATGASVRMTLPQNDRRALAERKFAHIATILKTARFPYDG
jgi:hypothetical protein